MESAVSRPCTPSDSRREPSMRLLRILRETTYLRRFGHMPICVLPRLTEIDIGQVQQIEDCRAEGFGGEPDRNHR